MFTACFYVVKKFQPMAGGLLGLPTMAKQSISIHLAENIVIYIYKKKKLICNTLPQASPSSKDIQTVGCLVGSKENPGQSNLHQSTEPSDTFSENAAHCTLVFVVFPDGQRLQPQEMIQLRVRLKGAEGTNVVCIP